MDQTRLQFGAFELKISSYELRREALPVKLERIPMELLILLVERRGELVSREEIIQRLWGEDVFLETEHSINTAINKLRAVLQDNAKQPMFVQTVIGKGYRFIADVQVLTSPANEFEDEVGNTSTVYVRGTAAAAGIAAVAEPIPVVTEVPLRHEAPRVQPGPAIRSAAEFPLGAEERPSRPAARAPIVILLLILLAVGLGYAMRMWKEHEAKPASPAYRSVAVLPFVDLSANAGREYPVDGMTDEVTTQLARGSSLRVVSQTSTMQYKGVHKPLAEIAAALNVDAVVEGSVMREGGTVRITAQLLDARHDQHLWAQTYKQSDADPLLMQDQVASQIAQEVAQRLGSELILVKKAATSPHPL